MQDLINAYFALSEQEREYFILAIAPSLCRTFQKNPDSIPRFCRALSGEEASKAIQVEVGRLRRNGIFREMVAKMNDADIRYQTYIDILKKELVPAMGCTEPIALAYCAAKARSILDDWDEMVCGKRIRKFCVS